MSSTTLDPNTTLQLRRVFAAPRERVFRAWIERDALQRWLRSGGAEVTVSRLDVQVGGAFRWESQTASGTPTVTTGRYLEINFPARLVFTWTSTITNDEDTLVTIEFIERGDTTEVILTHERFATPALMARHQYGWTLLLDRLAGVV